MKIYYCLNCTKEINHNVDDPAEDFLFTCPSCNDSGYLFLFDEEDTEILKGKTIDKIYNNQWADHSKLVLFTDKTHAIIDMPYSDLLEFKLIEHEYEDDLDDDFEDDDF